MSVAGQTERTGRECVRPGGEAAGQATGGRGARVSSRYRQDVCGVDEAGRGPWAGPVVVAAVILPRELRITGLADSKLLAPAVREMLFDQIVAEAMVATVIVAATRVDAMNIRQATLWGMARAVAALPVRPTITLIDGLDVPPGLTMAGRALVRGDQRSSAISAASIVAKVTRDRLMVRLAQAFPAYGFERHKGYGTPEHRDALAANGPCQHHRRSFAPVREALACLAGDGPTGQPLVDASVPPVPCLAVEAVAAGEGLIAVVTNDQATGRPARRAASRGVRAAG